MKLPLEKCQDVFDIALTQLFNSCHDVNRGIWEAIVRKVRWPYGMVTFLSESYLACSIKAVDVCIIGDDEDPDTNVWLKFEIQFYGIHTSCNLDYEYKMSLETLKELYYIMKEYLEETNAK